MTTEIWDKRHGIIYSDENFDPARTRGFLGLDDNKRMFMPKEEALRLANLLNRTGNLSDRDLKKLNMIRKPILRKKY